MKKNNNFNPRSYKQIGKVLLHLGIKTKTTDKGNTRTDSESLLPFQNIKFVSNLLKYRGFQKALSTYIKRFYRMSAVDGKLYPTYNQAVVDSNRLSSNEIHNVTKHSAIGKEIRKCIITPPGYVFVSFDFNQLQLRILAHYSQDKLMMEAYKNNKDLHQQTADNLGIERQVGKTINFALSFGAHAKKLKLILEKEGIYKTESECEMYHTQFFETYKGLHTWVQYIIRFVTTHGYAPSLFGFRKPLEYPANRRQRFFYEHCCANAPIMASEAQIVKRAMIRVYNRYNRVPAMHIHDEIIFLLSDKQVNLTTIVSDIQTTMEDDNPLCVPLKVCHSIGSTWSDL